MTQLEYLIYSLATVIVRYHDNQPYITRLVSESDPTKLRRLSRLCAIDIIKNQDENFDVKLIGVIKECTKGYLDREKYLTFLLNEISLLKPMLQQKAPLTPEELERLHHQITRFFTDIRQLLNKLKTQKYDITCSAIEPIEIKGLMNTYTGGYFCTSGQLLIEETLNRFNISKDSSDVEIEAAVSDICSEYQNALLVVELKTLKLELKSQKTVLELKVSELEGDKSTLTLQNSGLDAQKRTLELEVSELEREKATLTQQKSSLEELKFTLERQKSALESDKSSLTLQTFKLTEKNQIQETTLEGVRRDLEKVKEELRRNIEKHQKELQKHQLELERLKKQKLEAHQIQEKTIEELHLTLGESKNETQKTQLELQRLKKQKVESHQVQEKIIEGLRGDLQRATEELQKQQSEIEDFKIQKLEVHQAQEKTIEELRVDLQQAKEELQQTQRELGSLKKQKAEEPTQLAKRKQPIFPLYSGLTPFYLLNQPKGTFFQPLGSETETLEKKNESTLRPTNLE